MKKTLIYIITAVSLIACSNDLGNLNANTKDPSDVPGEALFTSAEKSLVDQMINTNVNNNIFRLINQHLTETDYTDESNYDITTRAIPEQHWQFLYKDVLKDLNQSAINIDHAVVDVTANPIDKTNKLAIIEILNVYTYAVLVETFGNIPYKEALNLKYKAPVYDDGLTIYKDLISRLNNAIAKLDPAGKSFGANDRIYNGNINKWMKFANTLKLRMGIVISDIPSETALAKATVATAAPFVFTSNNDNASLTYLSASPNTNPLYIDLVASGREDFVIANTLVDYMNTNMDPRRSKYFDNNKDDSSTPDVEYVGGKYGAANSYSNFTHITPTIQKPEYPGTILDYSETEFLLAEAAERSLIESPATAEAHYNAAITASIINWGGTATQATAYLAQTDIAYTTASGTWKEKIGTQSWVALYNNGFEGWTSWRRLDFPKLIAPADAVSGIPVRLAYPIVEQTLNKTNYTAASSAIGSDKVETKLFWDKF
jgi:hypothetical protein